LIIVKVSIGNNECVKPQVADAPPPNTHVDNKRQQKDSAVKEQKVE